MKISDALRAGSKLVREDKNIYLSSDYCGCALAMIAVACGLTYEQKRGNPMGAGKFMLDFIAPIFPHISRDLLNEIDLKHVGGTPALAIADWLDTLDVSKPKDAQTFDDFMKVVTQPVELEAA